MISLSKLVYKSTRKPDCTEEEIAEILNAAVRNNKPEDITGLLLYDDRSFVQYLEGPGKAISELYDKIKGDPRHKDVHMISYGLLKKRQFPTWAMGSRNLSKEGEVSFLSQIKLDDEKEINALLNSSEQGGDHTLNMVRSFVRG